MVCMVTFQALSGLGDRTLPSRSLHNEIQKYYQRTSKAHDKILQNLILS